MINPLPRSPNLVSPITGKENIEIFKNFVFSTIKSHTLERTIALRCVRNFLKLQFPIRIVENADSDPVCFQLPIPERKICKIDEVFSLKSVYMISLLRYILSRPDYAPENQKASDEEIKRISTGFFPRLMSEDPPRARKTALGPSKTSKVVSLWQNRSD